VRIVFTIFGHFWALIISVPSDPRFVNLADNSRNLTPTIKTAGDNAKGYELPNPLKSGDFCTFFTVNVSYLRDFGSKRKFAIKLSIF
jgi:hypothetical protein